MTGSATFTPWLEALGLEVTVKNGASGEELWVTSAGHDEPRLVVRQSDAGTWEVVHDRRLAASVLNAAWHAPWDTDPPAVVVGRAVQGVACGFSLVESETHDDRRDLVVRFRAPIYDEGLTRQAFVLTVSPVLKAAEAFDLVVARRAEELANWNEFEAGTEQRKNEQQELIDQMAEAAATPEATDPVAPVPPTSSAGAEPAAAWSPTHVVKRSAKAWAQPDPAGAGAGTLKRRVEVQVTERQGEWAQVVTANGWSGWIDSGDLKAR
jgi:hypothetical protein